MAHKQADSSPVMEGPELQYRSEIGKKSERGGTKGNLTRTILKVLFANIEDIFGLFYAE